MEKLKYDQAEEILRKSKDKDSVNIGENYVLSVLYFTNDFPGFSIDSAYQFITSSISDFETADSKEIEKVEKEGIGMVLLSEHKDAVETAAFHRTQKIDTEAAYVQFLSEFPRSVMEDSAIWYRHERGFENAFGLHTWERYELYMGTYPESHRLIEAQGLP